MPPPPPPPPPLLCVQINYLSKKKNHLSYLLKEQEGAVSQIVRELRAVRGSLGVIDAIHEELQAAAEDYSTASYTTPYYSYLVKRLPLENGGNRTANHAQFNDQFSGHQATEGSQLNTSSSGVGAADGIADINKHISNIEDSEKMADSVSATDSQQEKTPARSKWWQWTSGGGVNS